MPLNAPAWGQSVSKSSTDYKQNHSPLFWRRKNVVSKSWSEGPSSENSNLITISPYRKQYGFLSCSKIRSARVSLGSVLSKVKPLASTRVSLSTTPISTLFICSSSCVVNFTAKPPFRIDKRLPLSCGETRKGGTDKCRPLACPHLGTKCLVVNRDCFRNAAGPPPAR